jgi:phage terminase large subunit
MTAVKVKLPEKIGHIFEKPRGQVRYRCAYGGRGSGKSFGFAKMAAIYGMLEPLRILCTRELQNSIKESFHAELKNAIESEPWLTAAYSVGIDYIRGRNGTEFIFKGLRHNMGSIKSMAQIDICIIEEAEDVPPQSWVDLEPTIRADRSEIWVIWNPRSRDSYVNKNFILTVPERCAIQKVNYCDNPFFPTVLEELRKKQRQSFPDELYAHIWDGEYYAITDALVFRDKFRVEAFEPGRVDWDGPYQGLDFGFSVDPTAAVRCWIYGRDLCIEYDAGSVGLELDQTINFIDSRIPSYSQHITRADNARPESISYLKRHGMARIVACEKGKGSVEDGITFIKSFESVIIHPRCTATLQEFRTYSYKVDRHTGDVLAILADENNHYIDAIRYALEPAMKNQKRNYGALI